MPHKANATRAHPYGTRSQSRVARQKQLTESKEIYSLDQFLSLPLSFVPEWVTYQPPHQPPAQPKVALIDIDSDGGMPPFIF